MRRRGQRPGKPENAGLWDRRCSRVFAAELRRRGWLHAEGYAPGSWAAP